MSVESLPAGFDAWKCREPEPDTYVVDVDEIDESTVTLHHVTEQCATEWHNGPGWYFVIDDYLDEGSCGAFETEDDARRRAVFDGYLVSERIRVW